MRGLDLDREIDAATAEALNAVWLEYAIVLFRGVGTSNESHVRLSRAFGELEVQRAAGSDALWMPCGGRTLKTLNFEILDEYGNEVELPESCPISFSKAFEPREPNA